MMRPCCNPVLQEQPSFYQPSGFNNHLPRPPVVPIVSTQHPFAAAFCINLPPVQIPQFDCDPLAFHDWSNNFEVSNLDNRSISQTRRIT